MSLSNYPPGMTGNEYEIGGPSAEWEADEVCPHCGWEGPMPHESHYSFGIRAFCANPEKVEVERYGAGLDGEGYRLAVCPLAQEGFIVEFEPEYDREEDATDS